MRKMLLDSVDSFAVNVIVVDASKNHFGSEDSVNIYNKIVEEQNARKK